MLHCGRRELFEAKVSLDKMKEIHENLLSLLDYVANSSPPHRFLPYVTRSINAMIDELGNTNSVSEKLEQLALGLGMFISDDFEFSESETGKKILEVINSIVKAE
jgi:hypothetical protein